MAKLQYSSKWNGENVPDKNGLKDDEQEVCIYFSARSAKEGTAEVGSHIPVITRALLESPFFKINKNGLELSTTKHPYVISVSGRIPIQSLLIKSPRKAGSLASVIANKGR